MSYNNKKFLDANGVTQIVGLLDDYATNETLGAVVNSVQTALDQKVSDVQINGTSILNNGVANIPVAGQLTKGVVYAKLANNYGLEVIETGSGAEYLRTYYARTADIKDGGTGNYPTFRPITPRVQHESVFYGLAKAAGADMKDSANAVGTYTDAAKQGIQKLFGFEDILGNYESSSTASKAYTVGETFIFNGKRYRVTADIAQNYVITPGTNCELDPLNGRYVKDTDKATTQKRGLVKIDPNFGVALRDAPYEDVLMINRASDEEIKLGNHYRKPIVSVNQHKAVFYGLAKAAGDTTQSQSDNVVGIYTTEAKTAIRSLIGAAPSEVIAVQDTQPTNTDTKVWMMETPPESVEVPTYAEFQALDAAVVKKTDIATSSTAGIIKVNTSNGVAMTNQGQLYINQASTNNVKEGTANYFPIVPSHQHEAAFFGLAKAAGDTTQSSSSNAVGTYTTEAKAAILAMIGANGNGLQILNGTLATDSASTTSIKNASNSFAPIVSSHIHDAAFFGLAKAAGADMASLSDVMVGQYPQAQKTAIQTMLGIEANIPLIENVSGSTPTIVGMPNVRYICGEVTLLTITPPAAGSIVVRFSTGSSTTLTVPDTVKWPAWFDATSLDADTTYEIIITDGIYGGVMSWA